MPPGRLLLMPLRSVADAPGPADEPTCANCGQPELVPITRYERSVRPDGIEEHATQRGFRCLACGRIEERDWWSALPKHS
jgi:hypothetical protein